MAPEIPASDLIGIAKSIGNIEGAVTGLAAKMDDHIGDHRRAEESARWAIRTAIAALGVAVSVGVAFLSGGCS